MILLRPISLVTLAVLALAATSCDSGFLDPELAGVWGGQNLELRIEANHVQATLICHTTVTFPGDVRLDESESFQREGVARSGSTSVHMLLAAWRSHPDTLMALVYQPGPLVDPAPPIPLVRGQPGSFDTSLILCAQ